MATACLGLARGLGYLQMCSKDSRGLGPSAVSVASVYALHNGHVPEQELLVDFSSKISVLIICHKTSLNCYDVACNN